jgi:hypothetical protein
MAQPDYRLLDTNAPAEAALAPIRGMGAVNALRSQQLQNQAAEFEIQNALAEQEAYKQSANVPEAQQNLMRAGLGGKAAALGKTTAESQKLGLEGQYKKIELQRTRMGMLAADPSDQNIVSSLQQQVQTGEISPEQAQQAWSQVQMMNPEQRTQYFTKMGVSLDTLYKTQAEQQQRMQGTVPAGYRMTPEGTLEAIPGGPTTTPIAPKELQKREAAYPQAKSSLSGYESKADKFIRDIDELLENKEGLNEITGYLAGRVEWSAISPKAREALAKYNQITAKGGFQALQDIREMSKTGGALGSVSNQEGKQLIASFAAIDRRQEADSVRAVLEQLKNDIEGSKARIRETFDETYAYKQDGGAPVAGGAPITGDSDAAKALARFRALKKGQ